MYFDNSATGWTDNSLMLIIGKGDYSSVYEMTRVPTEVEVVGRSSLVVGRKILRNGVLYIERDGKTYDVLGKLIIEN